MVFRNLGWYYTQFLTVNVAMMCVTPMNEHGYFNFAGATASARATLDKADIVILEINENLPWVYGGLDECIHISDVDMIVEGPHGPAAQRQVSRRHRGGDEDRRVCGAEHGGRLHACSWASARCPMPWVR